MDLMDIAKDPNKAQFINHDGVLYYTRMACVPEEPGNIIVLT